MNNYEAANIIDRICNGVYEANAPERNALAAGAKALRLDMLTPAFIGIGASEEMAKDDDRLYKKLTDLQGQDGVVTDALSVCIQASERAWAEVKEEWGGVWAYEVDEELGRWYVREAASGGKVDTETAYRKALELARAGNIL